MPDLDTAAVQQLTTRMMQAVRAHYVRFDPGQVHVFEVLNSLATTAAVVLSAIDDAEDQNRLLAWFQNALTEELADIKLRAQGPTN
jgi:hypothetical protein